jgi:hypothetical protein
MEIEEIFLINIKNFKNSAELVFKTKDFTSSTILYFKTLFAVLDLIIFKDKKRVPKDHTERFRILEIDYKDYYLLLDKLYPKYRESYNMIISKEDCEIIKQNVEKLIREQNIL